MIEWSIKISEYAPNSYNSDVYLHRIEDIIEPCIIYLDKRLLESDFTETALDIFKDIFDEMPIISFVLYNDTFIIRYNNWVNVLIDIKQIYRKYKIEKILA